MNFGIVEASLMIITSFTGGVTGKALIDWMRNGRNGQGVARKEDIHNLGRSLDEVKDKIDALPCSLHGERIASLEERTKSL